MATQGRVRRKLIEWLKRYGPLEVCGWSAELAAAAWIYAGTGSLAAAALGATIGSSIGYYLPAYVSAVRWAGRLQSGRPWPSRIGVSHLLALRSLTVEFGPAEVIDSLLIRPAVIYAAPAVLDNVVLGWIVGAVVADLAFYALAIISYEKFKGLLARRPRQEEVSDGPVPSVAVA